MGMMIFRPGQGLYIPGVQVFQPRASSAAASGILDGISNVAAAYSLRKLRSAYAGSAVRVRRSSDSAEQDIGFDGTGEFDSAAFSLFVGGGSGYVKTWYDQSGNGRDATMATTANQPTIVLSVYNSKPTIRFDGGDDWLSASWSASQPFSLILSLRQNSHVNNGRVIAFGSAILYQAGSVGSLYLYANGDFDNNIMFGTADLGIISAIWNNTSSKLWKNGGTADGGNPGSAAALDIAIGSNSIGANNTAIDVLDVIILHAAIPTADHNTIGVDMATRYGLSWSTVT